MCPYENDIIQQFAAIQKQFVDQFTSIFFDDLKPRTIVVVPSLSLDPELLAKIDGHLYYEERLLCLLLLLRMPTTRIIYITSHPVDRGIIDYYLHLVPGITEAHAQKRLKILSCYDNENKPLTQKILDRPLLISRIKENIRLANAPAHLVAFNTTHLERTLSVLLGIPIFGCDPDLVYLGDKSHSREIFRQVGCPLPDGYEHIYDINALLLALAQIKIHNPSILKAVVKLNEGFSGDGNAIFYYDNDILPTNLHAWLISQWASHLKPIVEDLSPQHFIEKLNIMGGIVEEFISERPAHSPSVQCRINPLGDVTIISTHDQVLSGKEGQVYQGASFPCLEEYAADICLQTVKIGTALFNKGVIGRFGVDFMSYRDSSGAWVNKAIEINLRKGGTTHPFLMLELLTMGQYDLSTHTFLTKEGIPKYYIATDNLSHHSYKGITPPDLMHIAMMHGLLYQSHTQTGVIFHMISAISQYGKLGLLAIGNTRDEAASLYQRVVDVLDNIHNIA